MAERRHLLRILALGGREMCRAPRLSRDEMGSRQLARIRQLVDHAYATVPLYRELYAGAGFEPGDLHGWDDFRRLPFVSKELLVSSYPDRAISRSFRASRLIVSRSSGSSGRVLDVAYPAQTLVTYALATLRVYRMGFRYRPWHRHLYVYTAPYPFSSILGLYPLWFVSTLAPPEEILRSIQDVRPHLLVCYPSHLRQIAEIGGDEARERIRPRLISVSSEMSTQGERDRLSDWFGCPTLDNYSSEELARIAAQCRFGTYHVFEDMNYLEVVDPAGLPTEGRGLLVGTNLHNFAMPLIRYQQNDLGQVVEPGVRGCPCGWRFRPLRHLEGRRNDSFVLPSGRVLTSGFLLDATYEFLLRYPAAVTDFCLIQETRRRVRLEVVAGRGWSGEVAGRIAARFRDLLEPGVDFRVERVAACEKTRSGKRNPIVSRLGTRGSEGGPIRPEEAPRRALGAAPAGSRLPV
jgi:phenylacetate-CoA ligase